MNKVTFEYQGATFTVKAQSALQANVFYSVLASVARPILEKRGMTLSDVTPSLDALLTRYVQLMQVTTIEGDINLPKNMDEIRTPAQFDQWRALVEENDDLFTLWWNAYQEANKKTSDPNSQS